MHIEDERADRKGRSGDEDTGDDRGQRTTEEQGEPVRRRREQAGERLRSTLTGDRVPHAEHAGHRNREERVPDQEELVRLDAGVATEIGEEQDLEDRVAEHLGDEHPGADPVEGRAVARKTADEQDAQRVHVRRSVPRARATRSKA